MNADEVQLHLRSSMCICGRLLPSRPAAEYDVCSGEWDAGDHRCLHSQCPQILGFQIMYVAFAASAGEDLNFGRNGVEPIGNALGACINVEPLGQFRILCGNTDRAAARMTMMADIRSSPDGMIILDVERPVAVKRD